MKNEWRKEYFMRIKIWKWSLILEWDSNASLDHHCLNQIMDGNYDCEFCNPRVTEVSS